MVLSLVEGESLSVSDALAVLVVESEMVADAVSLTELVEEVVTLELCDADIVELSV